MANTLTNLTPDLYQALDIVSRELVGFIPAVSHNMSAERAAVNQTIRVPISPAGAAADVTPGTNPPDDGDNTFTNETITITKARTVAFRWTGEEQAGMNTGAGYSNLRVGQIAQAMRTLCNEVEADLAALYKRASRAFGAAGTTPFASSLSDAAEILKILKDNGAPESDLQLVIDTAAGVKMRSLTQLNKVNEAGNADLLRQGVLLDIFGLAIRESAQVKQHTAGTGAGYLLNDASSEIGDTTIAVDTGTGTILAGDIVTFAGTTHKYVVNTALAGGAFTIGKPGLRVAESDNDAVTVGSAYRANVAFHRSAFVLVTRPPAIPEEGDMAEDRAIITDPRSGLSFEVAVYPQYRRVRYEVSLAWGVACIKPEHCAILLG